MQISHHCSENLTPWQPLIRAWFHFAISGSVDEASNLLAGREATVDAPATRKPPYLHLRIS